MSNRQAVTNLVMALASFRDAKSVVALSKSPIFHHQYSSISQAIANLAKDERELKKVRQLFQAQWLKYFPLSEVNYLQTDVVNIFREHAPCLKGRQYRHKANNMIAGNQPIGIGFPLSLVNLADFSSSWSIPFSLARVKHCEDEIEVAAEQIKAICEREEFVESLNINAADSSYGVAKFINQVNGISNLVNVLRLRHGIKVYESDRQATGGADQIYGTEYHLIEESGWREYRKKEKVYRKYLTSIYEQEVDEYQEVERVTQRGKELKLELSRWSGQKMRTKQGHSMKEVEFEIIGIRVLEKLTGERVFKHDVFVAVVGEKRKRLKIEEIAEVFYHRFDLEVTNRFMKQNLFLEDYQTPDIQHLDNWKLLVQEAMWMLWSASTEVENYSEKWQQYSEPKEEKGGRKKASQTRKGLAGLISTFDKNPYLPKKCQKGLGRKKGTKLEPREQYKVVKKWQREAEIIKPKCQKE